MRKITLIVALIVLVAFAAMALAAGPVATKTTPNRKVATKAKIVKATPKTKVAAKPKVTKKSTKVVAKGPKVTTKTLKISTKGKIVPRVMTKGPAKASPKKVTKVVSTGKKPAKK